MTITIDKLNEIREKYQAEVDFRKKGDKAGVSYEYEVVVCGGTGCRSCKSKLLQE